MFPGVKVGEREVPGDLGGGVAYTLCYIVVYYVILL